MTTLAAERSKVLDDLIAQSKDEPLTVTLGGEEKLIVLSPETYSRMYLRRFRPQVVDHDAILLKALRETKAGDDCPDYDPWEDAPELRPKA